MVECGPLSSIALTQSWCYPHKLSNCSAEGDSDSKQLIFTFILFSCAAHCAAAPDEDDNYGFDIGSMEDLGGHLDRDLVTHGNMSLIPTGVDEDVVVNPMAPDDELKKMLRRKYGRYIGGLKAEFLRVRKKGKLPPSARQILKDWFNRHAFWPYPSVRSKVCMS